MPRFLPRSPHPTPRHLRRGFIVLLAAFSLLGAFGAVGGAAAAGSAAAGGRPRPHGTAGAGTVRYQETFAAASGTTVVINTGHLNLRAAASLTSAVVAVLPDGTWATVTAAPVTAGGVTWYPLDVNGTTGWSDGTYLAPASGAAGLLPPGTVVVNLDALNLRTAAGLSQPVATVLPAQTQATVLAGPTSADGLLWYRLNAGRVIGWAARPYLAFAPSNATAFSVGQTVLINTNGLRLRAAAGLTAAVLTTLPGGTTGTIAAGPQTADGYAWYRLQTASASGWVAGEYLRLP